MKPSDYLNLRTGLALMIFANINLMNNCDLSAQNNSKTSQTPLDRGVTNQSNHKQSVIFSDKTDANKNLIQTETIAKKKDAEPVINKEIKVFNAVDEKTPYNYIAQNRKEILEKRDAHSKTYLNPDGSFTKEQSFGLMHYLDADNNWKSLNGKLKNNNKSADLYEITETGLPVSVEISSGKTTMFLEKNAQINFGENVELLVLDNNFNEVSRVATGKSNNTVVNGNQIKYKNLWNNIDRQQQVDYWYVKTDYVLNQKPLLNVNNGYLAFEDKVEIPEGWQIKKAEDGTETQSGWQGDLIILNDKGNEAGRFLMPVYFDNMNVSSPENLNCELLQKDVNKAYTLNNQNRNNYISGTYKIKRVNGKYVISVIVPVEWLLAPERSYPVTVDPTASNTYSAGNISSCYYPSFNTVNMNVTIPAGSTVTATNSQCYYTAVSPSWRSDAWVGFQSGSNIDGYWYCNVNSPGTCYVTGTGNSNIANGTYPSGTVPFTLRLSRDYPSGTCNTTYLYVQNNTWTETVTYTTPCTAPGAPTLVTPANNAYSQPGKTIHFEWNAPATGTQPFTYTFYFYNGSTWYNWNAGTNTYFDLQLNEYGSNSWCGTNTQWYVKATNSCGNANSATRNLYVYPKYTGSTSDYTLTPDGNCQTTGAHSISQGQAKYYSFYATAGSKYYFSTCGGDLGCGQNTGWDTYLKIYGTDGSCTLSSYNDDGGVCSNYESFINGWTCSTSGTYYLQVTGYNSPAYGTYHLQYSSCSDPSGIILFSPSDNANIQPGKVTRFEWQAPSGGTLPVTYTLYLWNGSTWLNFDVDTNKYIDLRLSEYNSASWCGFNAQWYVKATNNCGNTNSATWNFIPYPKYSGSSADYTINPANNCQTTGSHTLAQGGANYYSFDATAGNTYYFSTCAIDLGCGTNTGWDTYLKIYGTDGSCSTSAYNDDGGSCLNYESYINGWACTATGTYYLQITGYNSLAYGNYFLQYSYNLPPAGTTCQTAVEILPSYDPVVINTSTEQDYWVTFTADTNEYGIFIVDSSHCVDTNNIFLYAGDCNNLQFIQMIDSLQLFYTNFIPGQKYVIKIRANAISSFVIYITPPSLRDVVLCQPASCEFVMNPDFNAIHNHYGWTTSIYTSPPGQTTGPWTATIWTSPFCPSVTHNQICGWEAIWGSPQITDLDINGDLELFMTCARLLDWSDPRGEGIRQVIYLEPNRSYFLNARYFVESFNNLAPPPNAFIRFALSAGNVPISCIPMGGLSPLFDANVMGVAAYSGGHDEVVNMTNINYLNGSVTNGWITISQIITTNNITPTHFYIYPIHGDNSFYMRLYLDNVEILFPDAVFDTEQICGNFIINNITQGITINPADVVVTLVNSSGTTVINNSTATQWVVPLASGTNTITYGTSYYDFYNDSFCNDFITVVIDYQPLAANTVISPACNSQCNGSASVTAIYGTPPYVYAWPSGFSGVSDLCAGSYYVTITDADNCTLIEEIVVNDILVTASAGPDAAICPGNSTQLNASGGTTYQWSPAAGLSSTTISNPFASPTVTTTYTVTVTDASGCTATDDVMVSVTNIQISLTPFNETCFGSANGSIDLTVAGGTTPYLFYWENSSGQSYGNSEDLNNLISDTYYVTVTDANNCSATGSIFINNTLATPWPFQPANGDYREGGNTVGTDAQGNVYVAGYFTNHISFGGSYNFTAPTFGKQNAFIVKFDDCANVLWARSIESNTDYVNVYKIIVDGNDDFIITGSFKGTVDFGNGNIVNNSTLNPSMFTAKYQWNPGTSDYDCLWLLTDDDATGNDLDIDANNDIYIVGFAITGGQSDVFVAKIDGVTGTYIWSNIENTGNDSGYGITYCATCNVGSKIFITGKKDWNIFVSKYDENNGTLVNSQTYTFINGAANSIISYYNPLTFLNYLYIAGYTFDIISNISEILVMKINESNLNLNIYATVGGSDLGMAGDIAKDIAFDSNGDLFITGFFSSSSVSFPSSGAPITLINNGYKDNFVAKYSTFDDLFYWAIQSGTTDVTEQSLSVCISNNGFGYITGYFTGNADFGNVSLSSVYSGDVFIARLRDLISYGEYRKLPAQTQDLFSKDEEIVVFPNPTSDFINIEINNYFADNLKISLTNMLNITLFESVYKNSFNQFTLNIKTYPAGIYLLRITINNESFMFKVIKN